MFVSRPFNVTLAVVLHVRMFKLVQIYTYCNWPITFCADTEILDDKQ